MNSSLGTPNGPPVPLVFAGLHAISNPTLGDICARFVARFVFLKKCFYNSLSLSTPQPNDALAAATLQEEPNAQCNTVVDASGYKMFFRIYSVLAVQSPPVAKQAVRRVKERRKRSGISRRKYEGKNAKQKQVRASNPIADKPRVQSAALLEQAVEVVTRLEPFAPNQNKLVAKRKIGVLLVAQFIIKHGLTKRQAIEEVNTFLGYGVASLYKWWKCFLSNDDSFYYSLIGRHSKVVCS